MELLSQNILCFIFLKECNYKRSIPLIGLVDLPDVGMREREERGVTSRSEGSKTGQVAVPFINSGHRGYLGYLLLKTNHLET